MVLSVVRSNSRLLASVWTCGVPRGVAWHGQRCCRCWVQRSTGGSSTCTADWRREGGGCAVCFTLYGSKKHPFVVHVRGHTPTQGCWPKTKGNVVGGKDGEAVGESSGWLWWWWRWRRRRLCTGAGRAASSGTGTGLGDLVDCGQTLKCCTLAGSVFVKQVVPSQPQ